MVKVHRLEKAVVAVWSRAHKAAADHQLLQVRRLEALRMFAFVAHLKQEECTVQAAFHVLEQLVQEILKYSNQPRILDQQHAALSLLTQVASDTSQVSAIPGFAFVSPITSPPGHEQPASCRA